jgi:integrase
MRGHIRQRGNGFVIIVDYGRDEAGHRKQRWHSGYATRKEAEVGLTKLLAAKDNGERPEEAPAKLTYAAYLKNVWVPYLADRVQTGNMRASAYDTYAALVARHIIRGLGHIRLRELETSQLEHFYAELLRCGRKVRPGQPPAGLSARTVRAVHLTVGASLRYAVRQRLIARNPAREVDNLPKTPGTQRACWDAEQTSAFLTAVKDDRLHALWLLAVTTGMRRSEIAALSWDQVDLDEGTVTVSRARVSIRGRVEESAPKTSKSQRRIAIAPVVVDAMKTHRRRQREDRMAWGPAWTDSGFAFTREDGSALHPESILKRFQRLAGQAGLPVISFHGLRHGHATAGLASGVSLLAMSKRLGHASLSTTADLYTHAVAEVDREAANLTANLLVPQVANR